ncbi:putative phosphotransferase enzyme family protein [Rosellinia necatrix]|uniref:Putative phosphotransferase enzyme family protein n=1 Tax=Rosellinia necatrix TaxID=77044 RepID=A0A1W2TW79_ROSNE|nr:putative phosphotransferase enzyme family protein [Rosellinia necatrix]
MNSRSFSDNNVPIHARHLAIWGRTEGSRQQPPVAVKSVQGQATSRQQTRRRSTRPEWQTPSAAPSPDAQAYICRQLEATHSLHPLLVGSRMVDLASPPRPRPPKAPFRSPVEPAGGMGSVAEDEAEQVARVMLSWHALELVSLRKVQTLWAGYGHVCHVTARAASAATAGRVRAAYGDIGVDVADGDGGGTETYALVLKLISPPSIPAGAADEGHLRKILSYEVEQNFYGSVAPRLGRDLPLARCIAATRGKPGSDTPEGVTAIMMTDLRAKYPVAGEKRAALNETQVHAALDWLSKFHRKSWDILPMPLQELLLPPLEEAERRRQGTSSERSSVWLNGGYTYLATRRKEYASLAADSDSEWSSKLCEPLPPRGLSVAEMVANVLTPRGRDHETLIHGDVKSENLFTTSPGSEVAFYDFQYVGLGLGVCDLAKLFTCSVPLHMLTNDDGSMMLHMDDGERKLLERYRENLLAGTDKTYDWDTLIRHWETALVDWLRFQASWGFWGNTEWLEARVRFILKDPDWRSWLEEQQNLIYLEANP